MRELRRISGKIFWQNKEIASHPATPCYNVRMKNILVSMHPYGNAQRQFLAGVSYYAHTRNDWALHFDPSPDRLTAESFARDGETGISGAIICEAGVPDLESILVYSPVPVVVFGSPRETLAATHSPVGWSMSDDEGIGAFAAEHFTSLGTFRSYAFVADPLDSGWSRGHCRGFKTRLKHLAKDIFVFTRPAGEGNVARRCALSSWLKTLAKPAAVLAANDIVGAEVLAVARAARIAVPDVMSVIGIGNDTLLDELSRPPLTSVAVDHEEEGVNAARLLQRMMGGRMKVHRQIFRSKSMKIVERESTRAVAPAAHLVESALQYISDNAAQGLKVADVVAHLRVSRRLLDMRFRQYHSETLGEAIMRLRLDEVRKRLLTTSLSVQKVAATCGFPNVRYLRKLYRARFGEEIEATRHIT